jgi:hypothetical protein
MGLNALCNSEAENPSFSFSFGCFTRFPHQKSGFWEALHVALLQFFWQAANGLTFNQEFFRIFSNIQLDQDEV